MGILLIAATFVVTNSIGNGPTTAFAQQPITVKVTISKLPKQTADASTQVTISQARQNNVYLGNADINIPGIGSGHVNIDIQVNDQSAFGLVILNIQGNSGSAGFPMSVTDYCTSGNSHSKPISIPGIGTGTVSITKVN